MSCESRSAHAIPAGPPPTMTTSASICGRSTLGSGVRKVIWLIEFSRPMSKKLLSRFGLLNFLRQSRDDVEKVTDYTKICYLEDRSFCIFIYGDNAARAFHADNMLNCTADSQRKIELWRDGLA